MNATSMLAPQGVTSPRVTVPAASLGLPVEVEVGIRALPFRAGRWLFVTALLLAGAIGTDLTGAEFLGVTPGRTTRADLRTLFGLPVDGAGTRREAFSLQDKGLSTLVVHLDAAGVVGRADFRLSRALKADQIPLLFDLAGKPTIIGGMDLPRDPGVLPPPGIAAPDSSGQTTHYDDDGLHYYARNGEVAVLVLATRETVRGSIMSLNGSAGTPGAPPETPAPVPTVASVPPAGNPPAPPVGAPPGSVPPSVLPGDGPPSTLRILHVRYGQGQLPDGHLALAVFVHAQADRCNGQSVAFELRLVELDGRPVMAARSAEASYVDTRGESRHRVVDTARFDLAEWGWMVLAIPYSAMALPPGERAVRVILALESNGYRSQVEFPALLHVPAAPSSSGK